MPSQFHADKPPPGSNQNENLGSSRFEDKETMNTIFMDVNNIKMLATGVLDA